MKEVGKVGGKGRGSEEGKEGSIEEKEKIGRESKGSREGYTT